MSPLLPATMMALLLPMTALAQGVTPYDTYETPSGNPNYQANLTPLPDDTDLLGPLPGGLRSPDLPGPARDFREIADIDADYEQWRASRQRQIRGQTDNLDIQRLLGDAQRRRFSRNGPDPLPGAIVLPPMVSIQPYPPLYGQRNDLITAPTAPGLPLLDIR